MWFAVYGVVAVIPALIAVISPESVWTAKVWLLSSSQRTKLKDVCWQRSQLKSKFIDSSLESGRKLRATLKLNWQSLMADQIMKLICHHQKAAKYFVLLVVNSIMIVHLILKGEENTQESHL